MSLPQFYRVVVFNNSGQTVTYNENGRFNLKMTGTLIDPTTGLITYTQLADDALGFAAGRSIVNGADVMDNAVLLATSEINNTVNLYTGLQIQLEVTHDESAAALGSFDMYLSGGDASGELPTGTPGYEDAEVNALTFLGSLIWPNMGSDDLSLRSNVIHV